MCRVERCRRRSNRVRCRKILRMRRQWRMRRLVGLRRERMWLVLLHRRGLHHLRLHHLGLGRRIERGSGISCCLHSGVGRAEPRMHRRIGIDHRAGLSGMMVWPIRVLRGMEWRLLLDPMGVSRQGGLELLLRMGLIGRMCSSRQWRRISAPDRLGAARIHCRRGRCHWRRSRLGNGCGFRGHWLRLRVSRHEGLRVAARGRARFRHGRARRLSGGGRLVAGLRVWCCIALLGRDLPPRPFGTKQAGPHRFR